MAESNKKPKRIFSAYGKLDKKARHWQNLPPVRESTNQFPHGDNLIYRMNLTTLEIGQGVSNFRGMVWLPFAAMTGGAVFGVGVFIKFLTLTLSGQTDELGVLWLFFMGLMSLIMVVLGLLTLALSINDLFGYIDAPVRFDRERRKVYVWASRKEGPLELDWDRITPLAQSITAPPYQVNAFKSVLLVDMDVDGDVRFEKRIPRLAQIGSALLNGEETLAAYEFVRGFMERGPQSLPAVKTHLVFRPRGIRPFVDVMSVLGGMMRPYPSLPKHQRSLGWLIFGVVLIALFSFILVPFQWTQGIAQKWTTRIPKWSQKYEELAAAGGALLPPAGSEPNDPPLLPHEKLIAGIWLMSTVAWYAFFIWAGMKH